MEFGRIVKACCLQKFNKRRLRPVTRHRRSALATEASLHRPPAVCFDGMVFESAPAEFYSITRHDEHRREGASTCSLTISTMTDKLNYRLLTAVISNASASASSSKAAHDDPRTAISGVPAARTLLWPRGVDAASGEHDLLIAHIYSFGIAA